MDDSKPRKQNDNLWFNNLALLTMVGALLGVGLGLLLSHLILDANERTLQIVGYPGELFLRALKLLVLPLIATSMLTATARLGASTTGSVAKYTLLYYACTTLCAAGIGLGFFNLVRPGDALANPYGSMQGNHFNETDFASSNTTVVDTVLDTGRSFISENIVASFVTGNMLGVIGFFLLLGLHLSTLDHGEVVFNLAVGLYQAVLAVLLKIVYLTPIGVMSLVATSVGSHAHELAELGKSFGFLCIAWFSAMSFHIFIFYPVVYLLVARANPYKYMKGLVSVWATAFGTSSSAATLPTTTAACKELGVSDTTCDFVLPLGCTINMDGAVIHYCVATLFIARLAGLDTGVQRQLITALVGALVSIGASPIPTPGVVNLFIVMEAADVPVIPAVSFLLAMEWLFDKIATSVNVTGDSFGAGCVDAVLIRAGKVDADENEDAKSKVSYNEF